MTYKDCITELLGTDSVSDYWMKWAEADRIKEKKRAAVNMFMLCWYENILWHRGGYRRNIVVRTPTDEDINGRRMEFK